VRREDYPWLHAVTAPRSQTSGARRLAEDSPAQAGARSRSTGRSRGRRCAGGSSEPRSRSPGRPSSTCCSSPPVGGLIVRGPVVDGEQANGIIRAVMLVGGVAVGTWTQPGGKVALAPFGALARRDRQALEREAQDVARFLT
jgi:hypothetical protein